MSLFLAEGATSVSEALPWMLGGGKEDLKGREGDSLASSTMSDDLEKLQLGQASNYQDPLEVRAHGHAACRSLLCAGCRAPFAALSVPNRQACCGVSMFRRARALPVVFCSRLADILAL